MVSEVMEEILRFSVNNPWFTFFGAITIIQIVPIKVDPWSAITHWIKQAIVGDLERTMNELKKDVEQEKIDNKRWNILDFANSCRNNRLHTKEEWSHCLSQLKEYEEYCESHGIPNGVIEEDGKYLRELYKERNLKNDFL